MDIDYIQLYNELINFAKNQNRIKKPVNDINYVCYHNHHIIPKSIRPDLKSDKNNQVLLTPKEHYKAHYYLWKAYPDDIRYAVAFYYISHTTTGEKLSEDDYNKIKIAESEWLSEKMSGKKNPMYKKNAFKNKTKKELLEIGKKISKKLKGRKRGIKIYNPELNIEKFVNSIYEIPDGFIIGGKKFSKESKLKMSISAKKRGTPKCAFRDKSNNNNPMFGKKQTLEAKTKSSLTRKLKKLNDKNYGTGGKRVYHNPITFENKYFFEGLQPENWILGRYKI